MLFDGLLRGKEASPEGAGLLFLAGGADLGSMTVMAIYRQLRLLPTSWRLGLLPVCRLSS